MKRLLAHLFGFLLTLQVVLGVTLEWDPSPDAWATGYAIHYGTSSSNYTIRIDVGNATSCTITNLTPGVTYYFAATAYTESGQENFPSEELRYTVPVLYETNRPAATTNVWMRP